MKCHYEVLDIARDADESEIKSAYRRLALKWHPDKNLDNVELAKEQFQVVQQAYEVLSDRQERAWYDAHRDQILRGSNSDFQDKSLDVFQYFTATCYKGFEDNENGFYTVYRNVFEQIAKEDMEFMDEKEFCEIPGFGNSTSDYDDVVKVFYDYWLSYSTKNSYSWLDPYDIREGKGSRRALKLIEKENKKVRQKARKERNEEVRNLVAFVRKRDKRVQAFKKEMEAKTLENRKKQELLSKQQRLARKEMHASETQADWLKFDNVQSELEEIEKHLAMEFGDEVSDSNEEELEEDFNNLYCIACNKVFKNPRAFQNHESSKKHRENVDRLKLEMLEDDGEPDDLEEYNECEEEDGDIEKITEEKGSLSEDESIESGENIEEMCWRKEKKEGKDRHLKNMCNSESVDEVMSEERIDDSDEDSEKTDKEKCKRKNKKPKNVMKNVKNDVHEEHDLPKVSDDDFDFGLNKNQRKKSNKKNNVTKTKLSTGTIENDTEVQCAINKSSSKKNANKKEKKGNSKKANNISVTDLSEIDISHCCVTCKGTFPSKNKLFDHLKKTGHGVYIPSKYSQSCSKKSSVKS